MASTIRIEKTVPMTSRFKAENGIVVSPMVNPSVDAGALIDLNSPPQINPTIPRIIPSKPNVAITGATTAAAPDTACLNKTRMKKKSTAAPSNAPAAIAKARPSQKNSVRLAISNPM